MLDPRYVLTDKNEPTRGDKSLAKHPVVAHARMVTPGYNDLDNLGGRLKKDAPTLPQEALAFIFELAASKKWRIQHFDIEAAFLSGAYFEREVYVRAPKGGLPATDTKPAITAGTILKLRSPCLDLPTRRSSGTRSTRPS